MKKKQNIANTLFLLVWAAMFCFAVLFTLHKPAPLVYSKTTSSHHQEKLSPEDQKIPLSWTEPTASELAAEQLKSFLSTHFPLSWLCGHAERVCSIKPNKRFITYTGATIRDLVQPNAP
ncbi:hypothetical protein [Pontibacter fetidus]|uniref:Uncharacterized protein n=1 Tax=Pontibacter fetidus TaxID=2700082 RepID=A0A6B2GXU0_9BACT|nr:hypothetical protein [Pontibacter fetidus]NDK55769.1 hypothetical protein [Pontibacter fetidus]